jgi:hypothetical protein
VAGLIPVLVTRFSKSMNRATRLSFSLTMKFVYHLRIDFAGSAAPDLVQKSCGPTKIE